MNRKQAEQIYMLSSYPQWQALSDVLAEDLQQFYLELSECSPENVRRLQGEIAQTKRILNIRNSAEQLLESEKTG